MYPQWGLYLAFSNIPIHIIVEGFGTATGELKRFLSPLTVERILKILPLSGRISRKNGFIYFNIKLQSGSEKPLKIVKAGTIAYWPRSESICIFYEDSQLSTTVTLLGIISSNLDIFKKPINGAPIIIRKQS